MIGELPRESHCIDDCLAVQPVGIVDGRVWVVDCKSGHGGYTIVTVWAVMSGGFQP